MKKSLNLIGFIVILYINYVINKYFNQDYSENLNQINFYEIIKEGLHPIGIFLLVNFFSRKGMKAKPFFVFMIAIMIFEFIVRYFKGKEIIEYNYVIGVALGLIIIFIIDNIKEKTLSKRNV